MTLKPERYLSALAALVMGISSFAHGADGSLFRDEPEPLIDLTAAEEFAVAQAEPELAQPEDPVTELQACARALRLSKRLRRSASIPRQRRPTKRRKRRGPRPTGSTVDRQVDRKTRWPCPA